MIDFSCDGGGLTITLKWTEIGLPAAAPEVLGLKCVSLLSVLSLRIYRFILTSALTVFLLDFSVTKTFGKYEARRDRDAVL